MKLFAIDSGRSANKGVVYDTLKEKFNKVKIETRFGQIDFASLKNKQIFNFDENKHIISSVDEYDPYCYGSSCDVLLPPEDIIYCSNDNIYMKFVEKYILVTIGKLLTSEREDIVLGINLTSDNIKMQEQIKNNLVGNDYDNPILHQVNFYDKNGDVLRKVKFRIIDLRVFSQGWTSLMYQAIKQDYSIDPYYLNSGLIIDIGRRTVDVLFCQEMNVRKPLTTDLGTEEIFKLIEQNLFNKYNIKKSTSDIETIIANDDIIYSDSGLEIDIKKEFLEKAIKNIFQKIQVKLIDNFPYTFHWILGTGGGIHFFKDFLLKLYPNMTVLKEPDFGNAYGIVKILKKNYGN